MYSSLKPIVVELPAEHGPALHIATEGALSRRAPEHAVPDFAVAWGRFAIPRPAQHAGAFAEQFLLLPQSSRAIEYCLPAEVDSGFGQFWQYCPWVGLDLPTAAVQEAWFERNVAMKIMATPSTLGICYSAEALAEAAWYLLIRADLQVIVPTLLDVAFALDADGASDDVSLLLAGQTAKRWRVGTGLFPGCASWQGLAVSAVCAVDCSRAGGRLRCRRA